MDCITSAQRYIRPLIHRTYNPRVVFQLLQVGRMHALVGRMRNFSRSYYIKFTKVVHPTYLSCVSDLLKLFLRPLKSVHPTYKSCESDLL